MFSFNRKMCLSLKEWRSFHLLSFCSNRKKSHPKRKRSEFSRLLLTTSLRYFLALWHVTRSPPMGKCTCNFWCLEGKCCQNKNYPSCYKSRPKRKRNKFCRPLTTTLLRYFLSSVTRSRSIEKSVLFFKRMIIISFTVFFPTERSFFSNGRGTNSVVLWRQRR